MTPPTPVALPHLLARLKLVAAAILGPAYAPVVDTLDRAVAAFALTFAMKALGSGFDLAGVVTLSYWQTAAAAALLAALSAAKSSVLTFITGSPALLAPASRTLRARRDAGYRPLNRVPVRPPGRPSPRPRPRPAPEGTP